MGLLSPCSLYVRRCPFVALLLTCFALFAVGVLFVDHVVLGLYAIVHTDYQFYHTIHESMALIFYDVQAKTFIA